MNRLLFLAVIVSILLVIVAFNLVVKVASFLSFATYINCFNSFLLWV